MAGKFQANQTYSVSSPDLIFPCYSLLANQMSKFSPVHLFPREQSRRTAENEWGWVIYNLKKNPPLPLFLSLFNLHSWSGLIIRLIKGDEFFITPSLSLLVSHNNSLSPSNGTIHSVCTNHPLLPASHLLTYISSSLFISLILTRAICSILHFYSWKSNMDSCMFLSLCACFELLLFFSFESPHPVHITGFLILNTQNTDFSTKGAMFLILIGSFSKSVTEAKEPPASV